MPTSTKLAIATMNDTSLANEISIRDLQLSRRSQGNLIDDLQRASREHWDRIQHQARQIHDLMQRLERLEKPEGCVVLPNCIRCGEPIKAMPLFLKGQFYHHDCAVAALIIPPPPGGFFEVPEDPPATVGNAYASPEGREAKQKAVESSGYDELEEAHKYLDTLGVKRRTDLQRKLYARHSLRGRIEILNGNKPKWRDAETDPPGTDNGRFLTWQMGIHLVAFYNRMDSPGRRWTINGNDCTSAVSHWQDLPAPPQATEKA